MTPMVDANVIVRVADEEQGKVLGQIHDTWVAREMMLAYFADKDVISPKVRRVR